MEIAKLVIDSLQIIVTIIALVIAWKGLSTWKRQLKGSHDFELSHRFLLSIYRCRDALKAVRNAVLLPSESNSDRSDWEASAYENRWNAVNEAFNETRAVKLEAEAIWNESFEEEMNDLWRLIIRLEIAIRHYLSSMHKVSNNNIFSKEDENVLYGTYGEHDQYNNDLEEIISRFESKIKPIMKR